MPEMPTLKRVKDTLVESGLRMTETRWNHPHNYMNPNFFIGCIGSTLELDKSDITYNYEIMLKKLVKFKWPVYFVSQELLDALNRTNIADNYPLDKLKFPFEAMLFVFPNGAVQSSVPSPEVYIPMLGIAKLLRTEYGYASKGLQEYIEHDRLHTLFVETSGAVNTGAWPLANTYKEITDQYKDVTTIDGSDLTQIPADPQKAALRINDMGALALKLILYLNQASVGLPAVNPVKRMKRKSDGLSIGVREAHFLKHERTYHRYPESAPTGIKQESGWRCGHFKCQWSGVGRTIANTIWIEPYPIGADREALRAAAEAD